MAATTEPDARFGPDWTSAAVAGLLSAMIVGIVVWLGFDSSIITEDIPSPFGLNGAGAGWVILLAIGIIAGLLYGALNSIEALDRWASTSRTGAILGLAYGIVLWVVAIVLVPLSVGDGPDGIGEYALSVDGFLGYALFGVLIGFLYLLVPVIRSS